MIDLEKFKKLREEGVHFYYAVNLSIVRPTPEEPVIPEGWEVVVKAEDDIYADAISHLGFYTDKPKKFAFKRRNAGRNEYKFFQPENDPIENAADLRRLGVAKHEAWTTALRWARDAWKRAEDYGVTWTTKVIIVSVHVCGVRVGMESLGGVEFDYSSRFMEVAADEVRSVKAEAIRIAKATVREICEK